MTFVDEYWRRAGDRRTPVQRTLLDHKEPRIGDARPSRRQGSKAGTIPATSSAGVGGAGWATNIPGRRRQGYVDGQ
jgi:hypothetical protein